MIGLAGPTGKMRWRYNGAGPSSCSVLATDDPQGLPRIWTASPVSPRRCGIALPTDEAGKYQPLTPQFMKYDEPAQNLRLLRPLPWNGTHQGDSLAVWPFYIPFILMIGLAIGKRPGKLRRSLWLIVLWLVVSLLTAIVWLCIDTRNSAAVQHYDWDGWYRVFFFGFHLAMTPLFVGLVAVGLYRVARWATRRLAKRPA